MVADIRHDIPELQIIGDPIFVVAFKSDVVDVYLVNDELKRRGWRMNALQFPSALHFCITRPNTDPKVVTQYLVDLKAAVVYAKEHQDEPADSGAMYGFGGSPQGNEAINILMSSFLDAMHETAPEVK
jgi:sphinganine-1-phosphate aldolase